LNDERESMDELVAGFDAKEILGDNHVTGRRNRQKLCQSFYDSDDNCLEKIHIRLLLFVGFFLVFRFIEDGSDHSQESEERNHRTECDASEGKDVRIEGLFCRRTEHQAESNDDNDETDGNQDQIDGSEGE
jgi:hypothetical protein